MPLHQRNTDAVVGGGGLKLPVKAYAKAFSQRHAPGAVDARAPGGVNDQLHATGLVEKALGDDPLLGRHSSQNGAGFLDVTNNLLCRRLGNPRLPGKALLCRYW